MAITDELKKLSKKMTGADASGGTIADLLKATADDYSAPEGHGGGDDFIVTLTQVGDSDTNFTADKSVAEISEARKNNRPVWVASAGLMFPVTHVVDEEGTRMAFAMGLLDAADGRVSALMLACSDGDKAWTGNAYEYRIETPRWRVPFVLSVDGEGHFSATTTVPFADIYGALGDHRAVVAVCDMPSISGTLILTNLTYSSDGIRFSGGTYFEGAPGIASVAVSSSDVVTASFVPVGT